MAVFQCKMCGGTIEFEQGTTVGVCEYCGSKQTFPKLDGEKKANLYDRANHFRRNNEFDKAIAIYEQILNEDNTDAEAYWSLVICRYGIEYVEDPSTRKRIPTVNRAQFTSIFDDDNYKSAIQYADSMQRIVYEAEAREINEIQKGILAISEKEEPFDVFICYKETDANGKRTQDSVLANDLYHQLTQEGFKVFFSRITLEDKLGAAYEPYIFAALNSAKAMVVIGTKPEYFNAVWVKNEWSRYLALIKNGAKKTLIPAYRDMDPYNLPEEFSHLQAQDMSKLGFMQDLIRGIKKIVDADKPQKAAKDTVGINENVNTDSMLKRAFLFLEDGEWENANDFCEKALNQNPECAEAYLVKMMISLQIKSRKDLANCAQSFENNKYYPKVMRFADDVLKAELKTDLQGIKQRQEEARKQLAYSEALGIIKNAQTERRFLDAAQILESIAGYEDASKLAEQCRQNASEAKMQAIYNEAIELMKSRKTENVKKAIMQFEKIMEYSDSPEKIDECNRLIDRLKLEEIEAKQQAELREIQQEMARKKRNKVMLIVTGVIALAAIGVSLANFYFIPNAKYKEAIKLYNNGQYQESFDTFKSVANYKDSRELMKEANYQYAVTLFNDKKYEEAIDKFNYAPEYEDTRNQILACANGIKDIAYDSAVALYNEKKYEDAISAFENLDGYRDSADQIQKCNDGISEEAYVAAVKLFDGKEYQKASDAFGKIDESYKDVKDKIKQCNDALLDIDYQQALSYVESKEYDKAITLLEKTGDYSDSKAQLSECKYQQALAKYDSKDYEYAKRVFTQLGDYKESKSYSEKCEKKIADEQKKSTATSPISCDRVGRINAKGAATICSYTYNYVVEGGAQKEERDDLTHNMLVYANKSYSSYNINWYELTSENGAYLGWVDDNFIHWGTEELAPNIVAAEHQFADASFYYDYYRDDYDTACGHTNSTSKKTNLRAEPNTNSEIVLQLPPNTYLGYCGADGYDLPPGEDWYWVFVYCDNQWYDGFIRSDLISD